MEPNRKGDSDHVSKYVRFLPFTHFLKLLKMRYNFFTTILYLCSLSIESVADMCLGARNKVTYYSQAVLKGRFLIVLRIHEKIIKMVYFYTRTYFNILHTAWDL